MKRVYCILLSVSFLLSLILPSTGLAANVESFLQINDSVNRYLLASASYDLSNPVSVVRDYSKEKTDYLKDRPKGYEIHTAPGGTVSISDGVNTWSEFTSKDTYAIYNLIPGASYHYVSQDADGGVVSEGDVIANGSLRMIQMTSSVRNVRDLGGWEADGGTVKYSRLFRGSAINDINDYDQRLFKDWLGISTEIDLRDPQETGLDDVSALGADTQYILIDMGYEAFLTTETNLARYNSLLNSVFDSVLLGEGTYIHCAAGADRTGQAAFLLLGLLGVSPVDLARDYELTSFSYERLWIDPPFQTMLHQMNAFKGETFQDKCAAFAQLAGVSLNRINAFRMAMIDGNPSELKPYEPRNGLYWDNGNLYYYENDEISGSGLMVLDGSYYYVSPADQTLAHDGEYEVTVTNGLMPQGTYSFDSQGRMIIPPPCSHPNTVVQNRKDPTCTEDGYSGDRVCPDCGELLEVGHTIPALGHSTVLRGAADATCTEPGYSGDDVCTVCGVMVHQGTTIPAKGHSWGTWTVISPATESAEGMEVHTCSVCGETESRTIPVLTHVHHLTAVAGMEPTCEHTGAEACWKCTGCGRLFSDADGSHEIDEVVVIPALGHDWDDGVVTKAPSCTEAGVTTYTCKRDAAHQRTEEIPAVGHTLIRHNAKEPTETESGCITYWECSVCSRLFRDAAGRGEITAEDTILAPVKCPSEAFTDVDRTTNSWYHKAVDWAVVNSITTGTSAVTFSPNAACTREQMVTFLWRANGSPEPKDSACPFSDVNPGDYSYQAILWASQNGVTNGTGKTTFSPKANVTREQVVTLLWRLGGSKTVGGAIPFTDVTAGRYSCEAVKWAAAEGITTGKTAAIFAPADPCTRAEIVTLLWRALYI